MAQTVSLAEEAVQGQLSHSNPGILFVASSRRLQTRNHKAIHANRPGFPGTVPGLRPLSRCQGMKRKCPGNCRNRQNHRLSRRHLRRASKVQGNRENVPGSRTDHVHDSLRSCRNSPRTPWPRAGAANIPRCQFSAVPFPVAPFDCGSHLCSKLHVCCVLDHRSTLSDSYKYTIQL